MPSTNNNNPSNYDDISGMQAILESNCVKVISEGALLLEMPHLWLRDNCPCDDCRVTETQEKSFILSDVPADISPSDARIINNVLLINWPDGHHSNFDIEEVLALSSPRHQQPLNWGQNFQPEYFSWTEFLSDDAIASEAIQSFLDFGVIVISDAPQALETLELLAPRLGPIREMLFDRIHNVCVDTHVYNVAHTPFALPPHNDFASYSFPPSAQALHMLENEVEGGKSIVVDAWAVAEELRQDRPDYFEMLCRFAVPFREFDEANETYAVEPIVKCDTAGRIISVRFSNQLMQTMDPMMEGVSGFYQAYHELCVRITDPMQRCTFRLEGGQVLLVAAHRVLHAREAFTPSGKRHLQDAYFELDHIANKIVQLKRNSEVTLV
jgi:gamma-butyrobetaine dioxygenase